MQQRTPSTVSNVEPLPIIYAQAVRETKINDSSVSPAVSPVVVAARPAYTEETDNRYSANRPGADIHRQSYSRESPVHVGEVGYIIHNQPPSAFNRRLPENQIAVARPVDPSRVLRNGWTGAVAQSNGIIDQEERWSSSLLACCEDANICIWVCCATPHAWATVAAAVNHQSFHLALIVYGFPWILMIIFIFVAIARSDWQVVLWMCLLFLFVIGARGRQAVRAVYNIQGSMCEDCIFHCCCHYCAICQEVRQLNAPRSIIHNMEVGIVPNNAQ
eukprot:CAMPEP_0185262286 /NCGR_PEP_ID=MMETSP1359-20130426/10479_1 /TAXON_ID=552665 /ORGANISM="Bigelowiella longifila, Strain CCMP242" /LENGTH=273 /DNA_ID=CAMNT_0027849187 /DNA_START=177 /DNA_END=998 /DNA_ORIENTATION=+